MWFDLRLFTSFLQRATHFSTWVLLAQWSCSSLEAFFWDPALKRTHNFYIVKIIFASRIYNSKIVCPDYTIYREYTTFKILCTTDTTSFLYSNIFNILTHILYKCTEKRAKLNLILNNAVRISFWRFIYSISVSKYIWE